MMQVTLCYLLKENKILLGMKKRGFGEGRWNGFGGKTAEGESIEDAAIREIKEEMSVMIDKKHLKKVATIDFFFPFAPEGKKWDQQMHVFFATKWKGEPEETEEMKPQWFEISKIPLEQMWADDPYWLPLVLKGKKVKGEFTFGKDNCSVVDHKVEVKQKF
ncbi:MAG: 8-oxo-dGTP diphosphatase [Candidatus Woesearchaeota archaeon]